MAPKPSFELNSLSTIIPSVFDQVQTSAATHKKNCVTLYKLQSASAKVTETVDRGRNDAELRLIGEKIFAEIFMDMLNRVLVVKKGVTAGDKIVKFVASYVKFLGEKASESDEEETPSSRFISRLLKFFLKGFNAKNKDVRSRCLQFVSEIVVNLGELDQDLYSELKAALVERLSDREHLARAYSVISLSKLAASEDPYELEDDEPPIVTSLLTSLYYDPAAEVRRAALIHIPFTPSTLPALLTRMRDTDTLTRKLVFSSVLPRLPHPRQLTISQREQIAAQGLGDRADSVRVAAARLLGFWVDACEGDLTAFIQLFDVQTPHIACDALKSVFVTRAEVVNEIAFDDDFWSALRPETALLARTFVEYCIEKKDESRLETALPVVTALAFRLQTSYNTYLEAVQAEDSGIEDNDDREEKAFAIEFTLGELLRLAVHLDYSDEIGRRKMFGVIRNMLAHPELPESLTEPGIGVLSVMSPNERDLVRVIVEIINELRDPGFEEDVTVGNETIDGDTTTGTARPGSITVRSRVRREETEMTAEEKEQADLIDLRCLCMCIAVLERAHSSFEDNSTLEGILADLIIPSVKRKELLLRERGLVSLGLCCLIAKNMAVGSFQLFLGQIQSAPESLRLKALQVVFDILLTYDKGLYGPTETVDERVVAFLLQTLNVEESKSVQALICLGLAKLMLFGLVTDERVLTSLVLAYVSPASSDNQELRQCLAYFLPVYCYSSAANQMRMQSIFITAFNMVVQLIDDLEDEQDMISALQFGQQLIDWTDATKVVGASSSDPSPVHVNLAIDILRALYDNNKPADERKALCQLLAKLTLPSKVEQELLYTLYILVANLIELCPFDDPVTDKAFVRFKVKVEKHFASSLLEYDEQACFHDEAYSEVFEFIGVTRPKKRRFEGSAPVPNSRAPESDAESDAKVETDAEEPASNTRKHKNTGTTSRKRVNKESAPPPSSDEEDRDETPVPSRSKGTKKNSEDDEVSASEVEDPSESESETSQEEEKENTPIPQTPPQKERFKRLHTPTKTPSMRSPAPKRQNRGKALVKNGKASKQEHEPLNNATNGKAKDEKRGNSKTTTRKPSTKGKKPPSYRSPAPEPSEADVTADDIEMVSESSGDEEDDSAPSDSSIPTARQRQRASRLS